ncbi:hypothetical protein KR018_007131 [Drosophila ironensis]|nr:hypothetical protein KR018_007131 [Drosophila ironensis]
MDRVLFFDPHTPEFPIPEPPFSAEEVANICLPPGTLVRMPVGLGQTRDTYEERTLYEVIKYDFCRQLLRLKVAAKPVDAGEANSDHGDADKNQCDPGDGPEANDQSTPAKADEGAENSVILVDVRRCRALDIVLLAPVPQDRQPESSGKGDGDQKEVLAEKEAELEKPNPNNESSDMPNDKENAGKATCKVERALPDDSNQGKIIEAIGQKPAQNDDINISGSGIEMKLQLDENPEPMAESKDGSIQTNNHEQPNVFIMQLRSLLSRELPAYNVYIDKDIIVIENLAFIHRPYLPISVRAYVTRPLSFSSRKMGIGRIPRIHQCHLMEVRVLLRQFHEEFILMLLLRKLRHHEVPLDSPRLEQVVFDSEPESEADAEADSEAEPVPELVGIEKPDPEQEKAGQMSRSETLFAKMRAKYAYVTKKVDTAPPEGFLDRLRQIQANKLKQRQRESGKNQPPANQQEIRDIPKPSSCSFLDQSPRPIHSKTDLQSVDPQTDQIRLIAE